MIIKKEWLIFFKVLFINLVEQCKCFCKKQKKIKLKKIGDLLFYVYQKIVLNAYGALEMMKWISHRYGFGTYIHFEKDYFSKESKKIAAEKLEKLIKIASTSKSNVFLETLISPSNTAAIVQAIQQPGISGQPNNMMLFEYKKGEKEWLTDIIDNFSVLKTAKYDLCILASSDKGFGYKKDIHVWIT